MRNTLLTYIDRFMHDRHSRKVLGSVLLVLAIVVSLTVYWQLRLHGIAITNETYCGYEEHVHTEECYETTLICGLEETVGLTSDWHTHDESCYDEEGNLVCELEECEPHTHTDECYETTLICEIPEHTHTSDCLVDLEADVEDATVWEATLPALAGDLRTDIVNIAYSQIGYTESTANYTLADDGTTKMGYTRYGAWYGGLYYGSEYSDWDSLFVAFCLDYAGIAEDFTYNSGAYAWSVDLTTLGYYQTADSYAPSIGDVAFIDTDADGRANITAIVVAVDESAQTIAVIQGNYTVTDSEGNSTDTVAVVTYSTATEIATQNEIVALSAGSEAEITPVVLGYANVTYIAETIEEIESEEVIAEETDSEEVTEEVAEEVTVDETEEVEEIASEESAEETATAETEEVDEQVDEEETAVLLTATASTDYVTQVTELYDYAMTLGAGDTSTAESVWNALLAIWEQIYAEEDAGTLTLTAEEYDSIDALTDEVYDYFVNTVGYDPYEVVTVETTVTIGAVTYTDLSSVDGITATWSQNGSPYYDSSTGGVYVPLILNFSGLDGSDIAAADGTFYVALPSDIEGIGLSLGVAYENKTADGASFTTTFYYDDSIGYYAIVEFNDDYDEDHEGYTGYISFDALYEVSENDTEIKVEFSDGRTITIPVSEIEGDDNETYNADVYIEKSAGTYDYATNSVTYEIIVYSIKGTDGQEITVEDFLAISGTGLSASDITSVVINSIATSTLTATSWDSGKNYSLSYDNWDYDTSDMPTVSADDFSVTLDAISATKVEDNSTITVTSNYAYKITYTITFDPDTTELSAYLKNYATATVEEKNIEDESSTVTVSVSSTVVDKTGELSSDGEYITWTITVNPNGADIAGYTFSDQMMAVAENGKITVTYSTGTNAGTAASADDYALGNSSITFNATNNVEGTNTNSYTITYTTKTDTLGIGESKTYNNTVTVTDKDEETVTTDGTSVTQEDSTGSVTKDLDEDNIETDTSGDYKILPWTITITIPEGGIPEGTVIEDYLGTTEYDTGSYWSVGYTHQWFTYAQICNLFKSVESIEIGNETLTYDDADYTLTAFDPSTASWVSYSTLLNNEDTYKSHVFTAYKITFTDEVNDSGTITLNYSTTADISTIATTRNFYNSVIVGSLKAADGYTERVVAYKTDGYNKTGTTSYSSTTGIVTWKVWVYVDDTTSGTISIADTIPKEVTITGISVDYYYNSTNNNVSIDTATYDSAWSFTNSGITASTDSNSVTTVTISDSVYSNYVTTYGSGYVVVTFTTKINDFDGEGTDSWSLENTADIYINDVKVTRVDQTQNITEVDSTAGTETKKLTKGYTFDENNGILDFYVVMEATEDDLKDITELKFKDVLQAYYLSGVAQYTDYGVELSLDISSVKFYELIALTSDGSGGYTYEDENGDKVELTGYEASTDLYIGTDGTVYYKSALDVSWTYSETSATVNSSGTVLVTHTISATVPVVTKLYVEYSYDVLENYKEMEYLPGYVELDGITNTATIEGVGSSVTTPKDQYEENTFESGISANGGLILQKVNGENYGTVLSGAKFALYVYDTTDEEYTLVTTYTTGEGGTITITRENSDLNYNRLYYLVEVEAPNGYVLDDATRYYFYWTSDTDKTYTLPDVDSLVGDSDVYVLGGSAVTIYAENYKSPETSLTVVKRDSTSHSNRLSEAVFKLQYWDGNDWADVTDNSGDAITYETDELGEIEIEPDGLSYNVAYRLLETVFPNGYYADTGEGVIYFWWSSSKVSTSSTPDNWGVSGSTYADAIDLSSASVETSLTNTPIPTTEVSVEKSWSVTDSSGNLLSTIPDNYTATVQLYYYLTTTGETTGGNTGGTVSDSVTIYFTATKSGNLYDGYTESTASSDSYTHYSIPSGQENVSIKLELSSYDGWWYEAYSLVDNVYSSYDSGAQMSVCGWTLAALDVSSFTASADYYVIYSSPAATKITISYTDSSSGTPVDYEYTYTTTGGWSQTKPETAGTGGTGQTTPTVIKYADLTGNGTEYTGVAYTDSSGNPVIITLTSNGWVLNGGTDVTTYGADTWTATVSDLPQYTYIGGTKYYYNYYFVETSASDSETSTDTNGVTYVTDAEYSSADGVTDSTITITNTVTQTEETILPETGGAGTTTMYEFGAMLILVSLVGAGAYRNISRIRKSLVEEPLREGVDPGGTHERLPDVRNRKFVIPRIVRKGDTRAGPEVRRRRTSEE